MSSGGSILRAVIPASLLKTIHDIKEIATKHTDEDIYFMLKECNMDPNETVQKLLYLDAFHEVKRKRDKKKPSESVQASERHRGTSGMQRRGARGSRGSNSSTYLSNDAGDRKLASAVQENGRKCRVPTSPDLVIPVQHNTQTDVADFDTNSSNGSAGPTSLSNWSSEYENAAPISADNIDDTRQLNSTTEVNKLSKNPALPIGATKQAQTSTLGPIPASTPSTTLTVMSPGGFERKNLESRSSDLLTSSVPVSSVYSSASNPVTSLNQQNPGVMGTIKCETGGLKIGSKFTAPESRLTADQDFANDVVVATRTSNINHKASQGVERSQSSECQIVVSFSNHNSTSAAVANQDCWSLQQDNGSSHAMGEQGAIGSLEADVPSLPKVNDSDLEQAKSQLNRKLESLNLPSHQLVIFPDHIQVPEAYRHGLTFGSLDAAFSHNNSLSENTRLVEGITPANQDASTDPSLSHGNALPPAQESGYSGHHPQSFPAMPENLSQLEVNVRPAALPTSELPKPEILPMIAGSPFPFLHTAPDYGYGIVPPMLGSHLVSVEGAEVRNTSVPSTPGSSQSATQTVGVDPNSVALSTQMFPLFRHPYLSNYIPMNPYFAHLYMPPSANQFLCHNGFSQQASTGNLCVPPQAAAIDVKFPISSMFKSGNIDPNLTHFAFPSVYGSLGSSSPGYGLSATLTPGSSSTNEDLTAPELKEKNMSSVVKQNEESHGWTSVPGRDVSTLQANSFYTIAHGQQVTDPPAHSSQGSLAGMYHLRATTVTPSVISSLPPYCQAMVGSVDSMVPPSNTYHQPHSQISWNSELLNRESV